jgi:DnaK suppressor protein
MTSEDRLKIKEKIQLDIAKLAIEIKGLEEKTAPIEPDVSLGRLTRMEALNEKSINDAILERSRVQLTQLEGALSRIDRDDFGLCIECDEEIALDRLYLIPQTLKCMECVE